MTGYKYERQCKPRLGMANPERIRIECREWMVRTGADPFFARGELGLPHNYPNPGWRGPDWCFDRYGMTRTHMSDGRIICIGGEHEDYYDPDFYIYAAVVASLPPRIS